MSYKILEHLAQSFIVDRSCMITKVDLYFSGKDTTLPFYMHVVKNVDGFPGDVIIPFSQKYVYPSDVTVGDGSVASTVTFDSPIYLESGEYSLCLGTSSNNYKIYCSEVGAVDDLTENVINEQPYVGVLFKSKEGEKWTGLEKEDLKFDMYRAKFTTGSAVNIDFKLADSELGRQKLNADPLEIFPANTTMRVYQKNHGMSDGSYVQVTGIEGSRDMNGTYNTLYGIPMGSVVANNFVISNATDHTYTITLPYAANGISKATRFGGPSVFASRNYRYDVISSGLAKIQHTETTVDQSIKTTSTDYSIDSTFTKINDGDNTLSAPAILAGDVTKTNNLSDAESFTYRLSLETADEYVCPVVDLKQLGIIAIQNEINNPTYSSENYLDQDEVTIVGATSLTITQSTSNTLFGTIAVPAAAQSNATLVVKGNHLTLSGGSALNTGKFRVVDVADDGSTIDIENVAGSNTVTDTASYTIVNGTKFIDDRAATGSTSDAQYITRKIDFKNPSTSINLRLDVNRPTSSNIELYFKTKLVGEETDIAEKEFVRMPYSMPVSLTDEFTEIETQLDNLQPFESLVFKIVLKSDITTSIPKCKNLRLIVLA